jgi:formylglycine-generating enzyme required for sulfatase activity
LSTALDRAARQGGEPNGLASRRATLAIALLRLGAGERLWPILKESPDPRCRSFVIDRFGPLQCDPAVLLDRLGAERDELVRAALLLGLGGFDERALPADRRSRLTPSITHIYRSDGSAAVHAAAGWLLGRWGRRPDDRPTSDADATRRWYVNAGGVTMVKVAGPATFLMGASPGELTQDPTEKQHRVTIDHPYDIGMTEVTVAQFRRFLQERPDPDKGGLNKPGVPDDLPITRVSWYDAAAYCNWLSKKDGIPPEHWCYEPNRDRRFAEGMKIAADYPRRRGYRLPTEPEWEYACRGGALTSRCYGDADELLHRYAWYAANSGEQYQPVARLLPNAFGLFDMHGNAAEWCQNDGREAPTSPKILAAAETVLTKYYRVVRGDHILHTGRGIRSARRFSDRPGAKDLGGFRVARSRP